MRAPTYRTRITLALVLLSGGAALATTLLLGRIATEQLTVELANTLRGVVATASLRINGDMFARVLVPEHPYGKSVRAQLQEIAAANSAISNLYAGRKVGDDFAYVVDGYAESGELAPYGERYPLEQEMRDAFAGTPTTNPVLVTDAYGTWISGYAPIRDRDGNVVGIVGADYSAAVVHATWWSFVRTALLVFFAVLLLAGLVAWTLGRSLTRPMEALLAGFSRLEDGDPSTTVEIASPPEFHRLAVAFNRAERGVQERDAIKSVFGTFLERRVAQKVLRTMGPEGIPAEMREITILFSDIRGYTSWSEDKHPMELLNSLNDFFREMIDVLLTHRGTIDKFIGDALMVLFGAPIEQSTHADNAVAAAVAMQRTMAKSGRPFAVGIGINTAEVVLGTVGSPKRLSYTAMGDGVNLAQRLESKALPGQILISQSTYKALAHREKYQIAKLAPLTVKGKAKPVEVYEVKGLAKRKARGSQR